MTFFLAITDDKIWYVTLHLYCWSESCHSVLGDSVVLYCWSESCHSVLGDSVVLFVASGYDGPFPALSQVIELENVQMSHQYTPKL